MPTIALNSHEHRQLRVLPPGNFDYLANVHMLPLVLQECGHAGLEYPVVFAKKEEPGQFQLVALFGLGTGENLFVRDGQWEGLYVPAIIHHIPFKLIQDSEKPDQMILGLDTDDERVQEADGEVLFDEAGNETEYLQSRKDLLSEYYEHDRFTRDFIATLNDLDLLMPVDMAVAVNDQRLDVTGVHKIDEGKLNELPDEKFLELRKRGVLPFIYAQMLSLNQFHRLAQMKAAI